MYFVSFHTLSRVTFKKKILYSFKKSNCAMDGLNAEFKKLRFHIFPETTYNKKSA